MLRAANQQQRAQAESEHQDTTALLLRIHSIPDNLLFPFSSSDPPSPAGAHLRTGTDVASTSRPKEASSQDTIRPSSFQHVRSYTIQQNTESGDSDDDATSSADPIAIWVSLSPCRGHMNITLFEGWRIVVQVPVRDWEDKVYTADDVKRAAMICMGRQLMGEKIICVPIDVRWSFESGEEGEDAHSHALESERRRRRASQAQTELDDFEVSSFRQSTDSSQSQLAIHIRRPSAPEPDTPDASTAENGHSPLEPRLLLQQQRSLASSSASSPSLPTPRRIAAMPDALSSTWSSSLANSESIQDYVTAPDHEDADQGVVIPPQSRSSVQSERESPPGAVRSHSTRRTSWVRACFPSTRTRTRRLLPRLHGAFGKFTRWALGRRTL